MGYEVPAKWPLVATIQNRDAPLATTGSAYASHGVLAHKDARLVNAYAEKDLQTGEWNVEKRPCVRQAPDIATVTGTAGGIFFWRNALYEVFGTQLYRNGSALGAALAGSGPYYFEEFSTISPPVLVFDNGSSMYYTDGTTVTLVTDVDLISPRVPKPVFLDGTLYVASSNGNIQGSDINNPASWSALNVINANSTAGRLVALNKQLSYLVALKEYSAEFFYNAANATGSPLGRVNGALLPHGVNVGAAPAVQEMDGTLMFPTQNQSGDRRVARLENLAITIISPPSVARMLNGEEFDTVFSAFPLRIAGHRFYVMKTNSLQASIVYDLDENLWYEWTDTTGTAPWIIDFVTSVTGTIASLDLQGLIVAQSTLSGSNGTTYAIEPDYRVFNDLGSLVPVDIYTINFDAGIYPRKKNLSAIFFEADRTPGSVLEVRCNDYDYDERKWTNFRDVNLDADRPMLDNCGSFFRRAYHFRHRRNTRFRIKNAHLQLDIGS